MKAEIKQKWLEALRGGKYKQAKGVLHSATGGFCCLGVLMDVMGSEWSEARISETSVDGRDRKIKCFMSSAYNARHTLPLSLRTELDILQLDIDALTRMNDSGKKFTTIAEYIESHL